MPNFAFSLQLRYKFEESKNAPWRFSLGFDLIALRNLARVRISSLVVALAEVDSVLDPDLECRERSGPAHAVAEGTMGSALGELPGLLCDRHEGPCPVVDGVK